MTSYIFTSIAVTNAITHIMSIQLAKCEEQNDFVMKAKTQTDKALHLDYGALYNTNPSDSSSNSANSRVNANKLENEELDRRRDMDIFIKPLDDILTLRSSVYDTPEDIESQVLTYTILYYILTNLTLFCTIL